MLTRLTTTLCVLIYCSDLFAATGLPPDYTYKACTPPSFFSYEMQILEDADQNGSYDHISQRDCNGTWATDCYPVSCNGIVHANPTPESGYHTFSSSIDMMTGHWVWIVREYTDSITMVPTATLERTAAGNIVYTNLTTQQLYSKAPAEQHRGYGVQHESSITINSQSWGLDLSVLAPMELSGVIEVVSLSGEALYRQSFAIDNGGAPWHFIIADLQSGAYLVRIITRDRIVVHKVLY